MSRRRLDLRQGSSAGQGVADEGMPAVVDGEVAEPFEAERFAGGAEAFADRVPGQWLPEPTGPERADQNVMGTGTLAFAFPLPGSEVGERLSIPPQRHSPAVATFGDLGEDDEVGSAGIDAKVIETEGNDLGDTKPGTAGETEDRSVETGLLRLVGTGSVLVEDRGEFAAGEDFDGVDGPGEMVHGDSQRGWGNHRSVTAVSANGR